MNPENPFATPTQQVDLFDDNGNPTPEAEIMSEYEKQTKRFSELTNGQNPHHYSFYESNLTELKAFNDELERDPAGVNFILAGRSTQLDSELNYIQK